MFVTGLLSCPLSNDFISKPQSQNPQGNLLGSLPTGADLSPSVVTWEVSLSLIASERVVGCLELLDCRGGVESQMASSG